MTKSDLINALNSEYNITKQEAATIVNVCFNEMSAALASGDRVERFRVPLLRPARRHSRGPGDRLGALHLDPLLGRAPGRKHHERAPDLGPRRCPHGRAQR